MQDAVRDIRPKVLFKLLEEAFPDRNLSFDVLLPTSMIGGLTLLESSILVTLIRLLEPRDFFEFGTYHGATSVLLAANSAAGSTITTLDLPPEDVPAVAAAENPARYLHDDVENDAYLRRSFAAKGALYLDRADESVTRKVRRLLCDSRALAPAERQLNDRFDFIFIDGGHDFETVRIDTANALRMARKDAVILWHDYRSTIHGDVTRFVDGYSVSNPVTHVENTMLAFTLLGGYGRLLPRGDR